MSWKRPEGILKTSWRRLQNILKTCWRCLNYVFVRCLENILNTSWRLLRQTSWRYLQNVLKTSWRRTAETNMLVLITTSSEDVWVRRLNSSWSRCLLKRKTKDVFKTSSRRLYQDECLLSSTIPNHAKTYKLDLDFHVI